MTRSSEHWKTALESFRAASPPSEEVLVSRWKESDAPLVSILCIAYNHESFIKDALHGFLLQETEFPFEIIVHDDASTDGTSEVIEHYRRLYPSIIRSVRQPLNLYSRGASPTAIALAYARGRFVCTCEGDDFWIDSTKLQTQAMSLISDPTIVISSHDAIIIDSGGDVVSESKMPRENRKSKTADQLARTEVSLSHQTWMIRKEAFHFPSLAFRTMTRDRFITSIAGTKGGAKFEDGLLPAVYRRHAGGIWSGIDRRAQIEEMANNAFWLSRYYRENSRPELAKVFQERHLYHMLRLCTVSQLVKARVMRVKIIRRLLNMFGQR